MPEQHERESVPFEAIPAVQITLRSMEHQILHHLGLTSGAYGEAMSKAISNAVANYPWEGEIKRQTHAAIQQAITRYFEYGAGYKAVQAALEGAMKKAGLAPK